MIIAVDIRFAQDDYQNFIYQTFKRIIKQNPAHTFIFISDKLIEGFINSHNSSLTILAQSNIPFLSKVLTDKNISAALKKNKVDVFVSSKFLSRTKVSQCLIFEENTSAASIKNAKIIITTSSLCKSKIVEKFKIPGQKIQVIYPGVDAIYHPVTLDEREKIKEQYAEGKEYFLFHVDKFSAKYLIHLLKAFSIFKKMQKSSMQLLITSTVALDSKFLQQLALYKYKKDLKILHSTLMANVTASAYAALSFSANEGFENYVLNVMQCDVPVIINDKDSSFEIFGNAALYIIPAEHKDLADKMMLIFKDEKLRSELIAKGKEQIKKYTWDKAADQLWRCIEKATK
jgi:glycosyltransferase involved in cell wall biosynthesis